MAGKKSDLGPIGMNVCANVQKFRGARTYADVSRQLHESGRDIPPLGLRRIEAGERRVDADDLVALAAALDVSPISLLMPGDVEPDTAVEVTGINAKVPAKTLWNWLNSSYALPGWAVMSFYGKALPSWERTDLENQSGPLAALMDQKRAPK